LAYWQFRPFGPGKRASVGAIAGGVVGGIVALLLGVFLYIMFNRRRKAKKSSLLPSSEDSTQLGNDIPYFSFYVHNPAMEICFNNLSYGHPSPNPAQAGATYTGLPFNLSYCQLQ
jgi:hypothetical protein